MANSVKLTHKLLTTNGVEHARNCLDKVTRHFLWRNVCSKNRFHAKDIPRSPIRLENVHF